MKKLFFLLLLLPFLYIQNPLITPASGLEMSVGASTWYAWWEPEDNEGMDLDPALLFGPALSVRLAEDWSISGVFLYGIFKNNAEEGGPEDLRRFDSDLSLNYNINRYIKIFAGTKYMGFSWDEGDESGTHWSAGPGIGIGSTIPLSDYLYLLANISYTYTWGKHDQEYSGDGGEFSDSVDLQERSINTNISLAYYIKSISTSINLGFRYQFFTINYSDEGDYAKDEDHYFYGITLAAVYSFSI
jgi:hypothetical protein